MVAGYHRAFLEKQDMDAVRVFRDVYLHVKKVGQAPARIVDYKTLCDFDGRQFAIDVDFK